MTALHTLAARFVRDETGAITVEYVLLAAAATAIGIASSDVIFRGFGSLSGTIDDEFNEGGYSGAGGSAPGPSYDERFDNGAPGWTGAVAGYVRGFGNVLGPIAGTGGREAISREFAIEPGAASAKFTFDLIGGDSLDDESGIVFIDGREVGRMTTKHNGATTFTPAADLAARGITFDAQLIDSRADLGGSTSRPDWRDSRSKITITIAEPKSKVKFGFGSNADQGVDDEFFAIDDFKAFGVQKPGNQS